MSWSPQSPEFPEDEENLAQLGSQYETDHPDESLAELTRDVYEMFSPPTSEGIISAIRRSRLARIFSAPVWTEDSGAEE